MKKITKIFERALVTGASSGIGEALCHLLAGKGIHLIITGRNQQKLEELATQLKGRVELQVDVVVVAADLGDVEERKQLITMIEQLQPDLVVNNAGYGLYGDVLNLPIEELSKMIDVNVTALMELSAKAAGVMIAQGKKGVVMNISSVAAFHLCPSMAVYAATKAFVNSFSEAFDFEVRPYGVAVLAACPGRVATEFSFRASKGMRKDVPSNSMSPEFAAEEIWKQIVSCKPVRQFDWTYRLGTFLSGLLVPRRWVARLIRGRITKNS